MDKGGSTQRTFSVAFPWMHVRRSRVDPQIPSSMQRCRLWADGVLKKEPVVRGGVPELQLGADR
jgi:hypothetical protein